MICNEKFKERYIRTYSDEGYKIRQIESGRVFVSAVDKEPCSFTYEETDELRADADKIRTANLTKIIDIIEGSESG